MNKQKITAVLIAATIITTSSYIDANATNINNKDNVSSSVTYENKSLKQGVLINVNNGIDLRSDVGNKGFKVGHSSTYDMLIINNKKDDYYEVTLKESGLRGYIPADKVDLVIDGVNSDLKEFNKNGHVVNVTTNLNLRENPTVNSNILKLLNNGDNFKILGKQGEWYKVRVNKSEGFLYEGFVKSENSNEKDTNKNYVINRQKNNNRSINDNKKLNTNDKDTNVNKKLSTNDKDTNMNKTLNTDDKDTNINKTLNVDNKDTNVKVNYNKNESSSLNDKTFNNESVPIINNKINNDKVNKNKSDHTISSEGKTQSTNKSENKSDENISSSSSVEKNHEQEKKTSSAKITIINEMTKEPIVNSNIIINNKHIKTDSNGEVILKDLEVGEHKLVVSVDKFQTITKSIFIRENEVYKGNIMVTPDFGNVILTIINYKTGKPLLNKDIIVDGRYTIKTDNNGKIILKGFYPGKNHIDISVDGFRNTSIESLVESDKTTENIVKLIPYTGSKIIKLVNYKTGKPVANKDIVMGKSPLKTDENGEVRIDNLWEGKNNVKLSVNGFRDTQVEFSVKANEISKQIVKVIPNTGSKIIKVVNYKTGKPVANKDIVMGKSPLKTDENGEVRIDNLWEGKNNVKLSVNGFRDTQVEFSVKANEVSKQTVKVIPNTGSKIIKVVNYLTGKPVANKNIVIGGSPLKTDENGEVRIDNLWEGKDNVKLSVNGFRDTQVEFSVKANEVSKQIVKVIPNTGSKIIKVVNYLTGKPVANKNIVIGGSPLKTDENGEVRIDNLWEGKDNVKLSVNGFRDTQVEFSVKANEVSKQTVKVIPNTGSKIIKVVNYLTGKPVANKNIVIGGSPLKTDENGEVRIDNLWEGKDNVKLSVNGFRDTQVEFSVKANEVSKQTVKVIPNTGSKIIKVVNYLTGKPVANKNIVIGGSPLKTDENGEVRIDNLWEGKDNVKLSVNGFRDTQVEFSVKANEVSKQTVKVIPNTGSKVIKVVNNKTGKPVANKNIVIGGSPLKTDENGEVRIDNLWEGKDNVKLSVNGFRDTQVEFSVKANEVSKQTVKVIPNTGSKMIKVVK